MISSDVWIKIMELFVEWKVDDVLGQREGLPSMWRSRKGSDIGKVEIVITKQREGKGFHSWTCWLPGVESNTLKNRNTVCFVPLFSLANLNVYIYFYFKNLKPPPPPPTHHHPPLPLGRIASHHSNLSGHGFSP